MSLNSEIWLSCLQTFPKKYSAPFTSCHANNWEQIKRLFRSLGNIRCSWMREMLKFNHNSPLNLDDHNDCFRAKIKYDILINGKSEIMQYFNQPQRWLKLSREFFMELARHKCISYFNTRISTNFFEYLDVCILELRDMRHEMVKEGVSLYDFVMRDKNYYEIDEIDEEIIAKYQVYGDIVREAMESAVDRKLLLRELMEAEIYTETREGIQVSLDCDSVYLIAKFMSNLDLKRLLTVF